MMHEEDVKRVKQLIRESTSTGELIGQKTHEIIKFATNKIAYVSFVGVFGLLMGIFGFLIGMKGNNSKND